MYLSWQEFIGLNLILLLDVYLFATFIAGLLLRYHRYQAIVGLIRKVPGRWPKIFDLLRQERALYLNRTTALPVLAALSIALIHSGLHRFVWHSAAVTPVQLSHHWPALLWVACTALLMVGMDFYMLFNLKPLNFEKVEAELDKAEYWLGSWVGSAINVVTLGVVSPRRIVRKEMRKAIALGLQTMDRAVWMWMTQIGCRLLFGFSLWAVWFAVIRESAA